ncbi:MAG: DUF6263 family protein [Armatimonadota bacterium]|nr:DUF6263 family protein [Armatimonadota bacterium]
MKIQGKLFVGAACLLAVAAYAAQDTFKLEWKPKVGDVTKYKIDVKASMDMGGAMGDIVFGMVQTTKVTKVADGKVVIDGTTGNMTLVVNGEDMSEMMGDQSMATVSEYTANGELISIKGDDMGGANPVRMENAYSLSYPNKDVKVGDKWSRTIKGNAEGAVDAEATYTVDGLETIGADRVIRIKGDFKETKGTTPMTVMSTVWLREKDGAPVKGTYNMKNVEFQPGMPPVAAIATMTLIP